MRPFYHGPQPKFKHYLTFFQILSILGTFIVILFSLEEIENARKHPLYILASVFLVFITYGFYILVKMMTLLWDYNRKPGGLIRCRRDLLIGYGMTAICGMIPQILVVFVQKKEIICICIIICNFAFIPIFLLFILNNFMLYKVKRTNNFPEMARLFAVICHLLYAVAAVKISETWKREKKELVASIVFYYAITFSLVTAEFFAVWWTGISLEEPRRPVPLRPPPKYSSHVVSAVMIKLDQDNDSISRDNNYRHNGSECNICLIAYSNLVIPRILIGCGHTICEGCVGKLLRNDEFQNRVICPFCRKITRMSGGIANELPKNFAILDMIEERNQEGT